MKDLGEMHMIRMIVLDLDGTLLNSKGEISEENTKVLKQISKKCAIVLASARGFYRIKEYYLKLGLSKGDNFAIAYNGGVIVDKDLNYCFEMFIENNPVEKIVDYLLCESFGRIVLYTEHNSIELSKLDDIKGFIECNKIFKVVFLAEEDLIRECREDLSESKFKDYFEITSSELTRIEFVPKGITKVNAIARIAQYLNINQSEVVAIGDGENDIEMIKYAGYGVAMGNATEIVKKNANIITDTNDNDGVAKVLVKLKEQKLID